MRALATAAVAAILALAACAPAQTPEQTAPAAPAAAAAPTQTPPPTAGVANPASVACIEGGGQLRMYDTPEGVIGICYLKDGRVCEEWDLFRDNKCTAIPAGATLAAGQDPAPARP